MKLIFLYISVLFFVATNSIFGSNKLQIKVSDSETSNPLPNVKVITLCSDNNCKDTIYHSMTNKKGIAETIFEFPFRVRINQLGYKPYIETVKDESGLNIDLQRKTYILDEVVTTGQFSPSSIQKSVYQVSSVSAEKIQAQSAYNLRELMINQMNISLQQDNILGNSMTINGISGQNVKIMVDGVPIIGRLNGNIDPSQINLNNAERVEIIEGPMSVMYGTDALGGVINIITKNNFDEKIHINGNSYIESAGTYNFDGSLGYNFGKSNILISGGRNFFGGFSKEDTSRYKDWKPKEQYFADWQYNNFMDKMTFRYNGKYYYDYILDRGEPLPAYRETAFDQTFKTLRLDNTLSLKGELAKDRFFDLQANYSFYERKKNTFFKNLVTLKEIPIDISIDNGTPPQDTAKNDNWMLRGTYSHDNVYNLFSYQIGFDLNYSTIKSHKIKGFFRELGDYAIFTSLQYKLSENIIIQPGLRLIHHTLYSAPLVPSINFKADLTNELTLRASYARGFRSPSIDDLYLDFHDINHNIDGNQDLKAETSDSYNLGFNIHFQSDKYAFYIEPSFFYNNVINLITSVKKDSATNWYTNINIGNNKSMGANISLNYIRTDISSKIGISWIGQSYKLNDTSKINGPVFNPEATANIIYNSTIFDLKFGLFYKYTGKATAFQLVNENEYQSYTIDDYGIFDFNLTRNFVDDMVVLSFGIKNIFDVVTINKSAALGGVHSDNSKTNDISWGRTFTLSFRFNLK